MSDMMKNLVLWVVIAVVLMAIFNNFGARSLRSDATLSYSQLIDAVKAGQVQQVAIAENTIIGNRNLLYLPRFHCVNQLGIR